MKTFQKVVFLGVLACAAASCESPQSTQGPQMRPATVAGVRGSRMSGLPPTLIPEGGRRNAVGQRLSGSNVMSAASGWSRYPLGTRFQIVGTSDRYEIDDYGGALIGTNTIDLYKTSLPCARGCAPRRYRRPPNGVRRSRASRFQSAAKKSADSTDDRRPRKSLGSADHPGRRAAESKGPVVLTQRRSASQLAR